MIRRTFNFYWGDDTNRLEVWEQYGIIGDWDYPMTFTVRECVEDWCEEQGYHLIYFKIFPNELLEEDNMESGSFKYIQVQT